MWGLTEPDEIDRQLNDMILRTIQGEAIPFDEWEDVKAQIEDEIDQWNEVPEGMSLEEALALAENDRRAFLASLERLGLSLENRFQLCYDLCERAKKEPSAELLRVFCDIVSDNDSLLDADHTGFSEAEYAQRWADSKEDSEELYEHLSKRVEQARRYQQLLAEAKSFRPSKKITISEPSAVQERIFQIFVQLYGLRENKADKTRLLDNIAYLLQLADGSQALATLKPLFLYQAMTQHKKRLQTASELHIDVGALWKCRIYKIEKYNGKNYTAYLKQLELFSQLCGALETDEKVDLPMCVYGFDHLSNLGEFYRMGAETEHKLPFAPAMEDLLLYSTFSCFAHGYEDNLVLADSGCSPKQLDKFMRDTNNHRALDKIADYMNRSIADLINRFLEADQDAEAVKALCQEILEASNLPARQQPKTMEETALFLAAINHGLMDAVDGFADDFLAQAGPALMGETEPESWTIE